MIKKTVLGKLGPGNALLGQTGTQIFWWRIGLRNLFWWQIGLLENVGAANWAPNVFDRKIVGCPVCRKTSNWAPKSAVPHLPANRGGAQFA